MEERICYRGAQILSGDELSLICDAALTVENGKILSIGKPVEDARQVDLSGMLLVPMFINAHCHLGDTGAKELGIGLPLKQVVIPPEGLKHRFLASLDRETQIKMMRHGLEEMLSNGIIACADFREQELEGVRDLRQAAKGLPIEVVILGRINEGHAPEVFETKAHGLLAEADGLGVRDVTSYDAAALARLRKAYPQKIFAAHVAENRDEEQLSYDQTGLSQAARAMDWGANLLVHLVYSSAEDFERIVRQQVFAISCARSNGILGDGLPRLAYWAKNGVAFALGTDNVMMVAPDMLREMEYVSRMTRGLEGDPTAIDTRAILAAATIDGARALRLDSRLGSLTPGKDASFIAFNLQRPNLVYVHDPVSAIVHRATVADIAGVYIAGKKWLT